MEEVAEPFFVPEGDAPGLVVPEAVPTAPAEDVGSTTGPVLSITWQEASLQMQVADSGFQKGVEQLPETVVRTPTLVFCVGTGLSGLGMIVRDQPKMVGRDSRAGARRLRHWASEATTSISRVLVRALRVGAGRTRSKCSSSMEVEHRKNQERRN